MIEKSGDTTGMRSILFVGVVLYALATWLSVELAATYRFPSDAPGDEPPWYFIRQDAIDGVCYLLYFLSCLAVGVWASRKKIAGGMDLVLFSLIWSASHIWTLFLILLRSDDIFDPARARTSWPTFASYHGDPLQWGWILILLALVVIRLLKRREEQVSHLASR